MKVSEVKQKRVVVQISEQTYTQIEALARDTGRTVPGYVRYLIHRDLTSSGLPVHIAAGK